MQSRKVISCCFDCNMICNLQIMTSVQSQDQVPEGYDSPRSQALSRSKSGSMRLRDLGRSGEAARKL